MTRPELPSPRDRELLGLLVDAVEPSQEARLREELAADPALRDRLSELRLRLMDPIAEDEEPEWLVPPPGSGAAEGRAQGLALMDMGAPGGASQDAALSGLRIRLPDGQRRLVVVLGRAAGRWQVLSPLSPDEQLDTSHLLRADPLVADGERILPFDLPEHFGRVALALPVVGEADPDWEAEPARRWLALMGAMSRGAVPVATLRRGAGGP